MPSAKPAAIERRKLAVKFEVSTPRCGTCKHMAINRDSRHICKLNAFAVRTTSVCDDWEDSKTGDKLEIQE